MCHSQAFIKSRELVDVSICSFFTFAQTSSRWRSFEEKEQEVKKGFFVLYGDEDLWFLFLIIINFCNIYSDYSILPFFRKFTSEKKLFTLSAK